MTEPLQILLIEDDPHLRAMLATALSAQGEYVVTVANGAQPALRIVHESDVDIILLDLGLPDLDGTALLPLLKQASSAAILVISARDTEAQKIAALDAGADDYLTKPFGIGELQARIRATRRRHTEERPSPRRSFAFGELAIDMDKREVRVAGEPVALTPTEFRLLSALAKRAGTVATHRQLLREVWGPAHEENGHYLRIYMRQLRTKLEPDPTQPRWLVTEPGIGYRLATE